jgi:hypothetical protein
MTSKSLSITDCLLAEKSDAITFNAASVSLSACFTLSPESPEYWFNSSVHTFFSYSINSAFFDAFKVSISFEASARASLSR